MNPSFTCFQKAPSTELTPLTYCCEKPISANGDGQFFAGRIHPPDDAIELLHEELQLALV